MARLPILLLSCLISLAQVNAAAVFNTDIQHVLPPQQQQQQQQPVVQATDNEEQRVYRELIAAKVIPDVLDVFLTLVWINATWDHASADLGNTPNVSAVEKAPHISLRKIDTHNEDDFHHNDIEIPMSNSDSDVIRKTPYITLALTDPDAPSHDDPKWSEVCHWLATGFELTSTGTLAKKDYKEIMPYYSPAPPPNTGRHRYVLVAMVPENRTTEPLELERPKERRHWGYDGKERTGLRMWAMRNEMVVIGANFFYAMDEEQ